MVVILILHDRKSSTKQKNKTTSCPTHVLVDVYATGSGRRVVDQRVNRRLCVQKILVLSVEPRGEVIADVLRCDLGDVLVRRNGAVVRLQEHHHFHPVMSGRSPPLYCTLTLIAMQGHQKRKEKKRKEKKRKEKKRCCCFSHSAYWLPTRKNYFTQCLGTKCPAE